MARMRFDTFDNPNSSGTKADDSHFGGYGYTTDRGKLVSTNTDDFTNYYRGLGEAAAKRRAYQADFRQANQDIAQGAGTRAEQGQANAMLRGAAQGMAPSRAAIMGQGAAGQSLQAAMRSAAGARGGLAQAAAQSQALQGQQAGQLAAQAQYGNLRANELAQARGAYQQGASGMRGQDYQAQGLLQQQADTLAQAENAQRELNQRAQMAEEQRAWDVRKAEQDRAIRQKAIYGRMYATDQAIDTARQDSYQKMVGAIAGAGGSAMSAGVDSGGPAPSGAPASDPGKWQRDMETSRSDVQTKQDVVPLYEPEGKQLHADEQGRAFYENQPEQSLAEQTGGASLSGGAPKSRLASAAAAKQQPKPAEAKRPMTNDEMLAWAREQVSKTKAQTEALPKMRTAVADTMDRDKAKEDTEADMGKDLARGLAPYAYSYKPGFSQAEHQRPGEQNVGPMAQNMASNPVTGSAVVRGPDGLLYISQPKALKLSLGAAGYLAAQQRDQEERLRALENGQ